MTTLVIGGGVLGWAIAGALTETGRTVTVLDEGAGRASDASLAWLNVASTPDPDYARVRAVSLRLWRDWAEEGAPAAFTGSLIWSEADRDWSGDAAMLSDLGWPAEAVDANRAAALIPALRAPPASALWAPDEGRADPRLITRWLRDRAEARGASLRSGRAARVMVGDSGVTGAALADGARIPANEVVIAAGCGGAPLLAPLGVEIPLRDAPGALAVTSPAPLMARPVLATPDLDFWQAEDGRFLIGTGVAAKLADGPDGPGGQALSHLNRLLPTGGLRVETITERMRPIPGDGLPAVGQIKGVSGLFTALTHSGMTLAPVIAAAARAWATEQAPPTDLARYGPERDFSEMHERRRS